MSFVANDSILAATVQEARAIARHRPFWLGLLGAGFVLGLSGPFGTYGTLPVAARLGYWLLVVCTSFWIGYLTSYAVAVLAEERGVGARISLGLGAVAGSLPVAVWLSALHAVFFGAPFWQDAAHLLVYVAPISLAVAFITEAMSTRDAGPAAEPKPPQTAAWLDQLPADLGRDLTLLQVQDHYLRVETPRGEALVRGTLQEAADDLGGMGVRVHRSWWVARQAVRAFEYRNGAPTVVLTDGRTLPVGRTYRRAAMDMLRPRD